VVVAPATADYLAKIVYGMAEDPLGGVLLATRAKVVVAPAMDAHMYDHPATQENLRTLQSRGVTIVGPESGRLASGLTGMGRLSSTEKIIAYLGAAMGRDGDLAGKRVVVSAGPTEEPMDPVRHISNRSTGKMGFAVAEAARDRGASVTLVTGPTFLTNPFGLKTVRIRTALEMLAAMQDAVKDADVVVMSAAVADYRPAINVEQKLKRGEGGGSVMELVENPDIIGSIQGSFVKIGFAAESQDLIANARKKLTEKNLVMVAANDITAPGSGFAVDTNKVLLVHRDGHVEDLPLMGKDEVADEILDRAVSYLRERERSGERQAAPTAP
jgi:phosphopantothenoylcysteine decarboxylase/phosphopantothenate--cysteine ligase